MRGLCAAASGHKHADADGIDERVDGTDERIDATENRPLTCSGIVTTVEPIEREVEKLTPEELAAFHAWFAEHDRQAWDREIERDVAAWRLDGLAAESLAEHQRGETTEL